jgi:hypothetical protein
MSSSHMVDSCVLVEAASNLSQNGYGNS